MYNYTIKEKNNANLSAIEILDMFHANPNKGVYDNLIEDISNKMNFALEDKSRNEATYLDVWYRIFDRCTKRGCDHLFADFEDMGLTVQLIPYFDNHTVMESAILCLLPKDSDGSNVQPIEYAIMHETLGLFVVMPLERWCPTWVEVVDNYAFKDEISLVYVTEARIPQCEGLKISLDEYLTEREKYIVYGFELCGRKMSRRVPLGYVAGKVYYLKRFYNTLLREPSNEPFISKEEMVKRIKKSH